MAGQQDKPLVIAGLRGRDGSTASVGVPAELGGIPWDMCAEAMNVDWYRASFARKRGGSSSLSLTFGSGGPFSGTITSLMTHMPTNLRSADELWALDSNFLLGRLTGGTTWSAPTVTDTPTAAFVSAVSLNGKLFLAHNSSTDRLHVWDGSTVRRVGIGTSDDAVLNNTGSGSYAATKRYYKIRQAVLSGTTVLRMGEASVSGNITPSGSGTAVRISKPATKDDSTHWRVEVSLDDAVYYVLSSWLTIATSTYDDSAVTTTYSSNEAAPLVGAFSVWIAVNFLTTDDNRLIGAGSWSNAAYANRVFFSPVMGTTSASYLDEERVPDTVEQKNYIDLDSKDGGFITGISRPFQGAIYVFKDAQIHKLIPTGVPEAPYRRQALFSQRSIGCLWHNAIVHAVDDNGRPALYWLSHVGPYRITSNDGLQFLGDDIQDIWDTVYLDVCYGGTGAPHGVYHAAKHQIWWWVPTNASGTANTVIVFDTRLGRVETGGRVRGGWSVFNGNLAASGCSVMFANTVGASMSADQKPYAGRTSGTTILKGDTAATSDNGTAFQAYVTLPERHAASIGRHVRVTGAAAIGSAGSHTLTMTLAGDYGAQSRTSSAAFTAAGTETRKLLPFEGTALNDDNTSFSAQIGDASATANSWTLDAVLVQIEGGAQVVQA